MCWLWHTLKTRLQYRVYGSVSNWPTLSKTLVCLPSFIMFIFLKTSTWNQRSCVFAWSLVPVYVLEVIETIVCMGLFHYAAGDDVLHYLAWDTCQWDEMIVTCIMFVSLLEYCYYISYFSVFWYLTCDKSPLEWELLRGPTLSKRWHLTHSDPSSYETWVTRASPVLLLPRYCL